MKQTSKAAHQPLLLDLPGKVLTVLAAVFILYSHVAIADVEQPAGYRMDNYDDLVPAGLEGASTITAQEVKQLQDSSGIVVIDVIPQHRRPEGLAQDQLWFPVAHKGVPGAIWLPDTGYGSLSDITEQYLKHHFQLATKANKKYPIAIYCRSDCWMSWNVAKRALTYGYSNIYWFYDGIDDWFFEGYDFEVLEPAPGQRLAKLPGE